MKKLFGSSKLKQNFATPSSSKEAPTITAEPSEFVSACRRGDLETVDRLISETRVNGADKLKGLVNSRDPDGRTELFCASRDDHLALVEKLLAAGANTETPTNAGGTPFLAACQNGHLGVVERLLAAETNIETPKPSGATPFFVACQEGHLTVAERLLAAGANINAPMNTGAIPLHAACWRGHSSVVERMLVVGANIDARTNEGTTPLFSACQEGRLQVVEKLLAAGANVDTPTNDIVTPLFVACQNGHQAVAERLLAAGAKFELPIRTGATPLVIACHSGRHSLVELLLSVGADRRSSRSLYKPKDVAKYQNHPSIVSLLSRPLPAATVAAHQQRLREIKVQQEEAKAHYLLTKRQFQMDFAAAKTKVETAAADAKRLLQQKDTELAEAKQREIQLRVEQARMNDVIRKAEQSDFNVEQGQLEVAKEHFARGGNGFIHQGRYHGTAVAVKYLSEAVPELYKQEVRMWCKLRHPNILQLLGLSLEISRPMIVMELMERSLFEVLHDSTVLEWGRRMKMAQGIAAGISYIHAQGAVHRDIKSLNVLVRGREVKIADFGSTRGQESLQETTNQAGTLAWLAPELFKNAPPSSKVDVYAFGVVMFELATREIPWRGCAPATIMGSVVAGERPQFNIEILTQAAGPKFAGLMQRCWNQKPEERPTSADVSNELTAILEVSPQPSFSSSASSFSSSPARDPPSPAIPVQTPAQPNYGNFSGFSLPGSSMPSTPSSRSMELKQQVSIPKPTYRFPSDILLRDSSTPSHGHFPLADPSSPLPACSSTDWSVEEWLTSIGLPQYIPAFQQNKLLTRDLIKELSVDELKVDLNIAPLGDRKTIVNAAKLL